MRSSIAGIENFLRVGNFRGLRAISKNRPMRLWAVGTPAVLPHKLNSSSVVTPRPGHELIEGDAEAFGQSPHRMVQLRRRCSWNASV